MRVIHVLRKPCSESTVSANTLKHGVGAYNIDASRISTDDNLNGGAYAENPTERWDGAENWRYKRGEQGNAGEYQQPSGRWPANVILQHLDGCRCDGVANWICEPVCPVARLDEQSGVITGVVRQPTGKAVFPTEGTAMNWNSNSVIDNTVRGFGDTGGASRFYKQVGGGKVSE